MLLLLLLSVVLVAQGFSGQRSHEDGDIQRMLKEKGFLRGVDGVWGKNSQKAFDAWATKTFKDKYTGQARTHAMFTQHYGAAKAYLIGLFRPDRHSEFTKIPSDVCQGSACAQYLRKDVLAAFRKMKSAAALDGVKLKILSGTRNFGYQRGIWERKWTGQRKVQGMNLAEQVPDHAERAKKILLYSSMPGTSRHHWGTDIDMNSLSPRYWRQGQGKKEFDWLKANAGSFGFCLPFNEGRTKGYQPEAWHWSYMPVAKVLLKDYLAQVNYKDIVGFKGADAAEAVDAIGSYVAGVNTDCK